MDAFRRDTIRTVSRIPLEGLTIKAALALGFGLTLGLWLFTGYYFTRRMSAVEGEAAAISARYMRAQERLSSVSAQVLLSSVYLRDALLDSDPRAIAQQRRRLEETYNALDAELDDYVPVLDTAAEREQVARLRQEVAAFRSTTREVLGDDMVRSPADRRLVLNTQVVPRRESIIRVTEDVRALNRTAFIDQQRAISVVHRVANQRSWQWLGVTLAVSLGIGLLATAYASRLEATLTRQRAVEAANSRHLQLLSAKLITAQEEERQNIARELHDEVGQVLTAVKVELAVAQRRLALSGAAAELLDEVQVIADAALHTVRDLSHLLHPSLLDDLGLPAAVDWYLRAFAKRYGIAVDLKHEGMTTRLAPDVELAAYRVVQEALTNVARHAGARHCSVHLRRAADRLEVTIRDNGRGFDPGTISESATRKGLGLLSMHERAAQLKGTVRIESAPDEGTRVTLDLPARLAPALHDDVVEALDG
jgi:signal transduction histidine kinase